MGVKISGGGFGGDGVNTFLALLDTPNAYVPNKTVAVNAGATGLEFISMPLPPDGVNGDTLRHDGTEWVADKFIENYGTHVFIGGASPNRTFSVLSPAPGDFAGRVGIGTGDVGDGWRMQVNGDIYQEVSQGTYGSADQHYDTLFLSSTGNFGYWLQDAIDRHIIYVSGIPSRIVSVANPSNIRILSQLPDILHYELFAQYGNYLYYMYAVGNVRIMDISDPYAPIVIGSFSVSTAEILSMCVSGDKLFIFHKPNMIAVYDLSNPLIPTHVVTYADPTVSLSRARRCFVHNNHLYIGGAMAGATCGFLVYDVSNLGAIAQVSVHTWTGLIQRLIPYNGAAYVLVNDIITGAGWTKIGIFDVTGGSAVWKMDFTLDAQMYRAHDMVAEAGILYVVDYSDAPMGNLKAYSISNPFSPTLLTEFLSVQSVLHEAQSLAFRDNVLFILQHGAGANKQAILSVSVSVLEYFGGIYSNGRIAGKDLEGKVVRLPQSAAPAAVANVGQLFVRSSDGKLCYLNPSGVLNVLA